MAEATKKDVWGKLREPFKPESIGKLPRVTNKDGAKSKCNICGGYLPPHIHLDFIGHAAITDRINTVVGADNWSWEPIAFTEQGEPKYSVRTFEIKRGGTKYSDQKAVMWGRLTINGATKPCVGSADPNKEELEKELISDLIVNGAMRFGIGLQLWSKSVLESIHVVDAEGSSDPFPPEQTVDIHEDVIPLSDNMARNIAASLMSKGIKDKAKMGKIMTRLAKELHQVDEFKNLTEAQGKQTLSFIQSATDQALIVLGDDSLTKEE